MKHLINLLIILFIGFLSFTGMFLRLSDQQEEQHEQKAIESSINETTTTTSSMEQTQESTIEQTNEQPTQEVTEELPNSENTETHSQIKWQATELVDISQGTKTYAITFEDGTTGVFIDTPNDVDTVAQNGRG